MLLNISRAPPKCDYSMWRVMCHVKIHNVKYWFKIVNAYLILCLSICSQVCYYLKFGRSADDVKNLIETLLTFLLICIFSQTEPVKSQHYTHISLGNTTSTFVERSLKLKWHQLNQQKNSQLIQMADRMMSEFLVQCRLSDSIKGVIIRRENVSLHAQCALWLLWSWSIFISICKYSTIGLK